MTYRTLDHVGFTVSDLDRSVEWYTRLLGEDPVLRKVWEAGYIGSVVGYADCSMDVAVWELPNDTYLELIQYLTPPAGRVDMETYNAGNGHLCLVTEDIDADYERLGEHARFRSAEPIEIPWGPYEGGRVCYLRDPDGISVELMQWPHGGPRFEERRASTQQKRPAPT
jgi:catechol 2,3-dioxygenase-like lactoylglutathione lyase family enzyme